MTNDEADAVIAALRSGRRFHVSNSSYGNWGFSYDAGRSQFHYESEFWGDDPENPQVDDQWLEESALRARLVSTYSFAPHFHDFVEQGPVEKS